MTLRRSSIRRIGTCCLDVEVIGAPTRTVDRRRQREQALGRAMIVPPSSAPAEASRTTASTSARGAVFVDQFGRCGGDLDRSRRRVEVGNPGSQGVGREVSMLESNDRHRLVILEVVDLRRAHRPNRTDTGGTVRNDVQGRYLAPMGVISWREGITSMSLAETIRTRVSSTPNGQPLAGFRRRSIRSRRSSCWDG